MKHWAIKLFEEKEADFNRRHPELPRLRDFDDEGRVIETAMKQGASESRERSIREEAILRERAYQEVVSALRDFEVQTDDLSDEEDRELERIVRTEVATYLRDRAGEIARLIGRRR